MVTAILPKAEKTLFSIKQVREAITNYHSNINRYELMIKELQEVHTKVTAVWGVEAVMPSGNGISDVVFNELQRREKVENNKRRTLEKIELIQQFCSSIWYDEMREDHQDVLNDLLEGDSLTVIANKNHVTPQAIDKKANKIAKRIQEFQLVLIAKRG